MKDMSDSGMLTDEDKFDGICRELDKLRHDVATIMQKLQSNHTSGTTDSVTAFLLDKPVEILGLSVRIKSALRKLGVKTISSLVTKSANELLAIGNFGNTSLWEVRQKLAEYGLFLNGDIISGVNPVAIDHDWLVGVRDSLDELYGHHIREAQTCSDHKGKDHHTLRAAEIKKQLDAAMQLINSAHSS